MDKGMIFQAESSRVHDNDVKLGSYVLPSIPKRKNCWYVTRYRWIKY